MAPQLSVRTGYRRCFERIAVSGTIPLTRCETSPAEEEPPSQILDLAARASLSIRDEIDSRAMHAAALIDLLWADSAGNSIERSITYLRMASRLADRPAIVLADLAAAHIVRAERRQTPRDLLEAIEAADRSLELDPAGVAARFNLAMALDRLGLDGEAARSWNLYLEVDSMSAWSDEVRQRYRKVTKEVALPRPPGSAAPQSEITAFAALAPQQARLFGWDHLLAEWGTAVIANDTVGAAIWLRRAGAVGEALIRGGGDATLNDAVIDIRRLAGNREGTLKLARGHREYAAAQAKYRAADYTAAGKSFEHIASIVPRSSSLRQWARLFLGSTLVYRGRTEQGERTLRSVVATADTTRHAALAGRARWASGTTALRRGRHDQGMKGLRAAELLYRRTGEREDMGAVQAIQAEASFDVGDTQEAYSSTHRALMTLRPYRASVWLHNALWVTASEAAKEGLLRAALRVQEEGANVAARTGRPMYLTEARLGRARLHSAAGRGAAATKDLAAARTAIGELPPGEARRFFSIDLRLSEAQTHLRDNPARAAALLDSVILFFGSPENPAQLFPALITRAEASLVVGDVAMATRDLHRAVALLDERATDIASMPHRAALLDATRAVFDRIVMLRVAANQPADALAYLERGRASLAGLATPLNARSFTRFVAPPGEIVLDYALVGDTLLLWTIVDTVVNFTRATVGRDRLIRAVERVRTSLELRARDYAYRPDLTLLYDLLVRPVQTRLAGEERTLVVVADGDIAGVPFAALYDSARARYLIEDHPLRFASSLRDAASRAQQFGVTSARTLLVADPAFDRLAFPGLRRLSGAKAEVDAIAAGYADPLVLTATEASKAALESALPRAAVVHYAGHALFDDERPDRSMLVLAPEAGAGWGGLTATGIARLDLRKVRLVVLSACQTVRARRVRSSGFAGLAGAFLSAGAGGVVGSTWRVDDEFTRALMIEFHRAYRASGDGARSLREAQLTLLRSPTVTLRSPSAWAGFRYAGL